MSTHALMEEHLSNGRLDQAESMAIHFLDAEPDDMLAAVVLARIDAARGNVEPALEALRGLMAAHPEAAEPPGYIAVLCEMLGDTETMRQYAQRSLELGGEVPAVLVMVAQEAFEGGDNKRALFLFDRALQLAPALATAWIGRGRILVEDGELADAEDAYVNAVTHGPQFVSAWSELIALEFDAGAEEVAHENLAVALRTHPGHPDLVALAARMQPAADADPVRALLDKMRNHLCIHDVAGAYNALDEAVALAPEDENLVLLRAELAIATDEGDFPGLVHQLMRAVRQDPNSWENKALLGRLLLRDSAVQNPRMGAAHLEDAWRISGENPYAGIGLVEAWAALKKFALAEALCLRLADLDHPVSALAKEILGDDEDDDDETQLLE